MAIVTENKCLKLFRRDKLIGEISNRYSDFPWQCGHIELTKAADPYRKIWEFWTTEGNREIEPPFEIPENIEEDWFIEDDKGNRTRIEFPAVHSDGEVSWCEY
ncbi:MAG: hypothetical protein K2X81_06700 [Candidatus Obscuribacterales bacterium]|nr:hypothetical protein [Candidatus Obscuribacterales bacterium]